MALSLTPRCGAGATVRGPRPLSVRACAVSPAGLITIKPTPARLASVVRRATPSEEGMKSEEDPYEVTAG